MINSQLTILNPGSFANGIWSNVLIKITYPMSLPNGVQQNNTNNKLSVNDIVVDDSGFVWKLTSVMESEGNYLCSFTEQSTLNPSYMIAPNVDSIKSLAVTPNSKRLLSPYYHDSYVSTNAFRAAMSYNMKVYGATNMIIEPGLIMWFEFKHNLNCSISNNILEPSRENVTYNDNGLVVFNNNGVNLNNANSKLSNPNVYTIEIKFKITSDLIGYKKLIDFNYYVFDTGLYILNNNICFYAYDFTDANKTQLTLNTFYTLKFIKNLNTLFGYIDGIKQFEIPDNNFITDSKSKLGFFTDDNQFSGEIFTGEINYIKLYDGIKL